MKSAIITGITGQDGSYLAELLLHKGYKVHGLVRRSSNFNTSRIEHLYKDSHEDTNLHLYYADLTDGSRLVSLIEKIKPTEIYNLAAQSHVKVSFDEPEFTGNVTGLGVTRILEALRITEVPARFYQASSSEMFGASPPPQDENTPFYPRSPYGVSKVYGYWMTKNYREAYGLFAANGILFNHESPRRGETFATRKITRAVAKISVGAQSELYLGNLNAIRDWGFAPEYVEAMWRILQQDKPDDYVIATGKGYSVEEFLVAAFETVNLNWQDYVKFDKRYERLTEVDSLIGNSTKAQKVLGWKHKTDGIQIAKLMVENDIKLLNDHKLNIPDAANNYWD